MQIFVDADACPVVIRDILFRAAQRTGVALTLVANQPLRVPRAPNIRALQVSAGFDVADNEIVRRVEPGDLVVTADIPLAAEVIGKGALALSPRGELFTEQNVRERLNMRDFMDTLRASGIHTGGPAAMDQGQRQAFANHLDRILASARTRRTPRSPSGGQTPA
ncbi:MAG: YaiI/YqxD family protein [Gammaproteobacteria bacterium]|nr:YaiI/YqxD family protein [Gammaproteobacteria bacterium]